MRTPSFVLALMLAAFPLASFAQDGAALPAATEQQLDGLFAAWNHADTPGAAVAVLRDGQVVYRKAFGMADIEQGRAITPTTRFHVASLAKQFTAFSILLLAQEGKLSLDDDVRQYLPEVPHFGQPIRIRHLLTHSSGLRDDLNLLALAGWRMEDVITANDVMQLVRHQQALNFAPGSDFAYNNTGYLLLAEIVQKVSGQSLAAFAKARIFDPLGMRNTSFREQYSALVAGRALSYQPAPDQGYEGVPLSFSTVGPTNLLTTIDDLALWSRNFDDARVGGKALIVQMQTSATLNDGNATDYGGGLELDAYRGVRKIGHSGSDAGFRSNIARFPEQKLSIIVLGNGADVQAARLGQRIADIVLEGQLKPLPQPVPDYSGSTRVALDPARLDALQGSYRLENGSAIIFRKENGHLVGWTVGDDPMPFYPKSEREFFSKLVNASFRFDPPNAAGVVESGTWLRNTRSVRGKRMATVPEQELSRLAGEYYSKELQVLYTVRIQDGQPLLRHPRGEVALVPLEGDRLVGPWPFGMVQFACTPGKGCSGFTINEDRASNVQFNKVNLSAAVVAP
ncbi:serine hydrolase domain-containing protein [Leeia aquatica]|uniref:Beta-lactamase family protein n=1 Tax=Leeia aquatica TaxID=2725557 RepID=A0A847S6C6_9NEIS|nr:serine hydrolase domain-containing protein [Leeia aquatica]NLR74365.1 beta-lactamase family protein [Leeia aquatica]